MTIKVSKPAINLREKLNELEQDTGLKGQELMRAETVAEARTAIGAGRKNLIINGGFDVWQRGTSGVIGNVTYATADRWLGNLYSNGTISLDKRTDATGQDFTTYARFNQSVAGTSSGRQGLMHYIEGDYAVGKTVTVSFKARASKTITGCVVRGAISSQTYTLTTSWQTFTYTGTGLATGSNVRLMFDFGVENDTWYVDLANVQLELGSVATEFEHRSYGEELALCQRYYLNLDETRVNIGGSSGTGSSYDWYIPIMYPVEMRVVPTATYSYTGTGATSNGFLNEGSAKHYGKFSVRPTTTSECNVLADTLRLSAEL